MRIYLAGGGTREQSARIDAMFAETIRGPLLYVPIAMRSRPAEECRAWLGETFAPHGIEIAMLTDLRQAPPKERIGGLYIGGGDTKHLLDEVRHSGFAQYIDALVSHDMPVYGGSAGAIILGKHVWWEGEVFPGLDLLHGFSVRCHYDERQAPVAARIAPTLCIPETSGILVVDQAIACTGPDDAAVFHEREERFAASTVKYLNLR